MLAAARGAVVAAARVNVRGLARAATARAEGPVSSNYMPLAEHDPELHAIIENVSATLSHSLSQRFSLLPSGPREHVRAGVSSLHSG